MYNWVYLLKKQAYTKYLHLVSIQVISVQCFAHETTFCKLNRTIFSYSACLFKKPVLQLTVLYLHMCRDAFTVQSGDIFTNMVTYQLFDDGYFNLTVEARDKEYPYITDRATVLVCFRFYFLYIFIIYLCNYNMIFSSWSHLNKYFVNKLLSNFNASKLMFPNPMLNDIKFPF